MTKQTDRRTFLAAAGATAATVALAGCSGGGDDDDNGGGSGSADVPDEVDSYLSDANNYGGNAVDESGSDSVSVTVGAGSDGLAFGPAAVIVSPGTEVTWEWNGEGGAHNVVSEDSATTSFDSGSTVDSSSETFSKTFESTGNNPYYCTPHQSLGMLGAIIVQEE